MAYQYRMRTEGVTSWMQSGTISIIDGRIYLCEWPLTELVQQFEGQQIEIAVAPVESTYTMDPQIEPLVRALQSQGVRTVSSCQGHLNDPMHPPHPWVAFAGTLDHSLFKAITAVGWTVEGEPPLVRTLRAKAEAATEEELQALQNSAIELAKLLWVK